ncbi:hypothetical protein [Roseicella aquatilis]|uniref:Uncharacterized protein n=1 Tax=Roseicella aquatilis TaxID=2527868 RepID=A0A4R4D213_9PROT|nr:hypothetical protein [Roseicella aquatilis]TCZ51903.1 hypothetical protein EXY23_26550 [Roseicella aquatilis]
MRLADYRHHLTPRHLLGLSAALVAALLLLPFLPPYSSQVGDRLHLRHLEAMGRDPATLAAREAAARRAAEEQERQRQAEARAAAEARQRQERERQEAERREAQRREQAAREAAERQAQADRDAARLHAQEDARSVAEREHAAALDAFRRIARPRQEPFQPLLQNVTGAARELARRAADPAFYRGNIITPEDTATRRACGDPASTGDFLWNRDERRTRNIYACAVFLSSRPGTAQGAERRELVIVTALLQRVNFSDAAGFYPLHTLVAFTWIDQMAGALRRGETPPRLPPLMAGEEFNTALFPDLAQGFARRMLDGATAEEKLALARNVYPDLEALAQLAARMAAACRTLARDTCLPGS